MEPIADLAPTASAAFDAAYDALALHSSHAHVRAHIADRVVRLLLERRTRGGMRLMSTLAYEHGRRALILDELRAGRAGVWEDATVAALDAAMKAAARVLAEG